MYYVFMHGQGQILYSSRKILYWDSLLELMQRLQDRIVVESEYFYYLQL